MDDGKLDGGRMDGGFQPRNGKEMRKKTIFYSDDRYSKLSYKKSLKLKTRQSLHHTFILILICNLMLGVEDDSKLRVLLFSGEQIEGKAVETGEEKGIAGAEFMGAKTDEGKMNCWNSRSYLALVVSIEGESAA
ncbi:Uncharacterized protein Fot_37925 [Forsythia ovata]|uniref:Uncharacterized protein n=1 Tax=Forsythia ovata TaxID=205694 RepID=A0ABD1S2M6_9LAMI